MDPCPHILKAGDVRMHEIKWKSLIPALALPLATGALAGFLTRDGMRIFSALRQPPLSPPAWLFPVVWTALYLMMGTASYLVWNSGASSARKERALTVYGLSLAANFLWPIVFFTMEAWLPAFFLLLVLLLLAAVSALLFFHISSAAGRLMLPYLVWLLFAGYLNLGVWLLNR